jgi:hypothetical protein
MRFPLFVISLCLMSPLAKAQENTLTAEERASGWTLLFDGKTTQGWHSFKKESCPASWNVVDGWLHCIGKGGGDVVSEKLYDQFDLSWDWKIAPGGNSGLKYFVLDSRNTALGHEYQLIDDERHPDGKNPNGNHGTASFYDVLKPTVTPPTKPPGEVNHSRILVKGNHIEHWLNGVRVIEYECGSAATLAAVKLSKFKTTPDFGTRQQGHILLQEHGGDVWFRNIKIRDLADKR